LVFVLIYSYLAYGKCILFHHRPYNQNVFHYFIYIFLRMCFKIVFVRFAIKFNGKLEKIVFGLN